MSGVRILVVDDNPHVRWDGRVHPVNATFHRFLAAVLDAPGGGVREIHHAVPLRDAESPPPTLPVDPRILVAGTAPFDGIAGYLRHLRSVTETNRRALTPLIEGADLVWLKVPASNAALAGRISRRTGTARFGWVAGSAWRVARALPRNLLFRIGAVGVGSAYDLAGRWASGPRRIVVGRGIVDGGGIVASLVDPAELRDVGEAIAIHSPVRLAWAGRLAGGKGLATLLEILVALPDAELIVLGDGPARPKMEAEARRRGVARRIDWRGYVAERAPYLDALASADILVHPSPAEGFPKVVLDAMAVGLPVVAVPSGGLGELAKARLIGPVRRRTPAHPASSAVMSLLLDPDGRQAMRERAAAFAAAHTAPAEATRLVERLRSWFPDLPWD
ncbi:MAG TPA: glycosyltransferase [Candidatus Limnocylindrales bacterium]|nr:glycosyltransferase [Candidatus Limnocylindrales bacterium]